MSAVLDFPETVDLCYRVVTIDGVDHAEFFVVDAEGIELASFNSLDHPGGAYISPACEDAANMWIHENGFKKNWHESWCHYNKEKSISIMRMFDMGDRWR